MKTRYRLRLYSVLCLALIAGGVLLYCISGDAVLKITKRQNQSNVEQRQSAFVQVWYDILNLNMMYSDVKDTASWDRTWGMDVSWRFRAAINGTSIPSSTMDVWRKQTWDKIDDAEWIGLRWRYCREDGSAFVFAIDGERSALNIGIEKIDEFPKDLIVVVESSRRDVNWKEPLDMTLQELEDGGSHSAGSEFDNGFHILFADGELWYVRNEAPREILSRLCDADTIDPSDRNNLRQWLIISKRLRTGL